MAYWEPRWEWLRSDVGAPAVMDYLLNRKISDSFNPHAEAPWTQAKQDMIDITHSPIDTWVRDHVVNGEELVVGRIIMLAENEPCLMTAKELSWCYMEGMVPWNDIDRRQSMAMVKALKNARVQVANQGKKIKYNGVTNLYYWVGSVGKEQDYQGQLDQRPFWQKLVASQTDQVANANALATKKEKF